jgi:hypothetical protein
MPAHNAAKTSPDAKREIINVARFKGFPLHPDIIVVPPGEVTVCPQFDRSPVGPCSIHRKLADAIW